MRLPVIEDQDAITAFQADIEHPVTPMTAPLQAPVASQADVAAEVDFVLMEALMQERPNA